MGAGWAGRQVGYWERRNEKDSERQSVGAGMRQCGGGPRVETPRPHRVRLPPARRGAPRPQEISPPRRLSDIRPASLLLAKPPNPNRGNGQNLGDRYTNRSQIVSSDHVPFSMKGAVLLLAAWRARSPTGC